MVTQWNHARRSYIVFCISKVAPRDEISYLHCLASLGVAPRTVVDVLMLAKWRHACWSYIVFCISKVAPRIIGRLTFHVLPLSSELGRGSTL